MKIMKRCVALLVLLAVCCASTSSIEVAATSVDQFPIGIFWPPSPDRTTQENYEEIADMNVNFVLMGNGNDSVAQNDAALDYMRNVGLQAYINDTRLAWYTYDLQQSAENHGFFVSNTSSVGQTITIPSGVGWGLNTVKLHIDNTNWTSSVSLTLSVYDSVSKTNLVASDTITGPVSTTYPEFSLHVSVTSGQSYYLELTSNSSTAIGWVTCNTQDVYTGGQAYIAGAAQANMDCWFDIELAHRMYFNGASPSNETIADIVAHYEDDSAVRGYNIIDEPRYEGVALVKSAMDSFRSVTDNQGTYVNLFPIYVGTADLGIGATTGDWITATNTYGQTFRTNASTTLIESIQIYVDSSDWSADESLTLTLWNGTAKTQRISQVTMQGGKANNYPAFLLNANVQPNTEYYFEVTHTGGGDGRVGWIIMSDDGVQWDSTGTAYNNGVQVNRDLWFTVNQLLIAFSYEDYVYRWASTLPDFLMYDFYPYQENGQFLDGYYLNMEIIRRQALQYDISFWTYLQSCGMVGSIKSPNKNELRYQIYSSLAYGAKGICYFLYETPNDGIFYDGIMLPNGELNTTLYNNAKELNAQVLALGTVLQQLTSTAVYHVSTVPEGCVQLPANYFWQPSTTNNDLLIGELEDNNGTKYIFVVNKNYENSATCSFEVTTNGTVYEISNVDGSVNAVAQNGTVKNITATFLPGEGRLYKIS